ncbi:MAG: NAD(P)-dependent oxidoreductase [Phycisphaerales bacterium]|nr:NAD(P)-dependent oxidoreductase [Phycisphaerales bacterium]
MRSMRILITGSAGHLGEAMVRSLQDSRHEVVGIDILESSFTTNVGSITDRTFVARALHGVDAVVHAATLHKPHVATHSSQAFVDVNITGTLNLLEGSARAGVKSFVFTSTTSVFGQALHPTAGAPAVWVTEALAPVPRNIYGVSKAAAEDLCELAHRKDRLACIILRTSRFFPEEDDKKAMREAYDDGNVKAVEFLYRRVDIEDVVSAHLCALNLAPTIGFGRYIISATTPFEPSDTADLRVDAPLIVRRRVPKYEAEFSRRGWRMFPEIDRVYDNTLARRDLGWSPRHDFASLLGRLQADEDLYSPLARAVGSKGYHAQTFADGPYPVD